MRFGKSGSIPSVVLILRLLLGGILIAAGIGKIANLSEFAGLVASYGILPWSLSLVYGYLVPWIEILVGCLLILGLFTRPAAGISLLLAFSFLAANIFSFFHKVEDTCGCFGQVMPLAHSQSLFLDLLMIALAVPILLNLKESLGIESWLGRKRVNRSAKMAGAFLVSRLGVGILLASMLVSSFPLSISQAQSVPLSESFAVTIDGINSISPEVKEPVESLDIRIRSSLAAGRMVLVYFSADWCGVCQEQKPIIDTLANEYAGSVSFILVNEKDNPEALREYGVKRFPTMFLISGLNPDGSFISREFVGLSTEETLRQILDPMPDRLETGNVPAEDLDLRIEVSLKAGKPAFLYFYSDGCHICQQQKPVIDKLEASFSDAISFIRIDGLDRPETVKDFAVTGFPTMVMISGKALNGGYIYERFVGFTDELTLGASLSSSANETDEAGDIKGASVLNSIGENETEASDSNRVADKSKVVATEMISGLDNGGIPARSLNRPQAYSPAISDCGGT